MLGKRLTYRNVLTDEAGAAAVEFAIIVPLVLLVTFGIFEFGRYYWIQNQLQYATEQTARYAYINAPVCDSPTMTTLVTDPTRLVSLPKSSVTVTASIVSNASSAILPKPQSCRVQAILKNDFTFLGYLGLGTVAVGGVAEYPCTNPVAKDDTCPAPAPS